MSSKFPLGVGDRVKSRIQGAGTIVRIDEEDEYVPYYVRYDGKDFDMWAGVAELTLLDKAVTLTGEQAERVREALQAIGWNRDDLGPLAAPTKVIKATITLPDDEQVSHALDNIEAEAASWNATIEFGD